MQKVHKKRSEGEYSYPLIKNLEEAVEEDHTSILPSYQPIVANSQDRISSKIVRCCYLPAFEHSQIVVALSPFSEVVEQLSDVILGECSNCKGKISPFSHIQNHSVIKCYFCGKSTQELITQTNIQCMWGYRSSKEQEQAYKLAVSNKRKRLLFVIEVSQYIYETKLHQSIFTCLSALDQLPLEVGFILFDNSSIYFINPKMLELTKVTIIQKEDQCLIPSSIDNLFMPVTKNMSELQNLIDQILYQAFYLKQTVLNSVLRTIDNLPQNIQVKTFITTLTDKLEPKYKESTQQAKLLRLLKEQKNRIRQVVGKQQNKVEVQQSRLQITGNNQFYIIPYNTNYGESIKKLGFGVAKIYNIKEARSIQNELYYDLFDAVNKQTRINTLLYIRTKKQIDLQFQSKDSINHFGNVRLISKDTIDSNIYCLQIKRADPSFTILLHFKSKTTFSHKPLIQFSYFDQINHSNVVLNVVPFGHNNQLEQYDDQLIFQHHFRDSLTQWKGHNFKELKQLLRLKITSTAAFIKDSIDRSDISLPKNWKHYLLYSFILEQRLSKGQLNIYNIYQYATINLELFSKRVYPRTYRIDGGKLKNTKTVPCVFNKCSIVFVEDGQRLFMVLNEPSVGEIKNIFGRFDTIPSLAQQHPELAELPSNKLERQSIDLIRSLNQHSFLPLRIIDFDSYLFTENIENLLWKKQDFMFYLKRTWKYA